MSLSVNMPSKGCVSLGKKSRASNATSRLIERLPPSLIPNNATPKLAWKQWLALIKNRKTSVLL